MHRTRNAFFSFLLVIASLSLHAQDKHPSGLWLGYNLRVPVGKKFSWNSDCQIRFRNEYAAYDYTLIRTAIQYLPNEHFSTSAGMVFGTDNYEAKAKPVWVNEKRLFQEARYVFGKLEMIQSQFQFRLEERWFETKTSGEKDQNTFIWRSRYRFDIRRSLNKNWRINAGDEYMLHFANNKSSFNQNRVWLGISRILGRNEVQAQLMQIIWPQPDATVLRLSFLHQLHS